MNYEIKQENSVPNRSFVMPLILNSVDDSRLNVMASGHGDLNNCTAISRGISDWPVLSIDWNVANS